MTFTFSSEALQEQMSAETEQDEFVPYSLWFLHTCEILQTFFSFLARHA